MDILITILCCLVVLSVLVFIHEGGHFITARLFGVRVSEFMLGLPGPRISFKRKDTRFGVTCIPLGGYARVCGMEAGNMRPYLPEVLKAIHTKGEASAKEIALELSIKIDEAEDALEELIDWGCVARGKRKTNNEDKYLAADINGHKLGEPREVKNKETYFKNEYFQQYRSLPFWKRTIILLAGIFVNILFSFVVFIVLYSIIGFDVQQTSTGEITHVNMTVIEAIMHGLNYIWAVLCAVANLFNPATMADTVSNSTSLIGIAVISKSAAEAGICAFLEFMAMISISLGIMNLLPIPPLDGGRFIIEIVQKITKKNVSERVINIISFVGLALILLLFVIVTNQDIQRFILGN